MRAYVLKHVAFEDLGNLEPVLLSNGYQIRYFDASVDDLTPVSEDKPELLVVLGGPIGVYENEEYPCLTRETALVKERIAADLPVLGICLGSQIIAHALGARVYPGGAKEIGWSSLKLAEGAEDSPLRFITGEEISVLHWHGDTFDIPEGAELLASTDLFPHQAFRFGNNVLGLQFHPEVPPENLEKWYVGHAHEIASVDGISVPGLREDGHRFVQGLQSPAQAMWQNWLEDLSIEQVSPRQATV